MSNTLVSLKRKIAGAGDLQSVVRTMKSVAAANIGQYEKSVNALDDYCRAVELGLSACFKRSDASHALPKPKKYGAPLVTAVVFGSDQGLVGQFNDLVADLALRTLTSLPKNAEVWAVGNRVQDRLESKASPLKGHFDVPNSIRAITPLVGQVLIEAEKHLGQSENAELHLFYNQPTTGASYTPVHRRLLPLDEKWHHALAIRRWPNSCLPEVLGSGNTTLRALIREYLFVLIYQACAYSLASENSSRLAAMQRADKNIDDLLVDLNGNYHRLRQSGIDEELFDVISGFEALS